MTTTSSYIDVNWGNMTSFTDFVVKANMTVNNWLFTGIDFMIFFILFITLSVNFGWESALMSSGFIAIILTTFFVYMGLMNFTIAGIFVGAICIMILYIMWSNRYD